MQHESTGPFFFQVCVCICYGVAAQGALVTVMSALSIESPEFSKRCKWNLNSFSCIPQLLPGVIA